jgi:hypothetical protein
MSTGDEYRIHAVRSSSMAKLMRDPKIRAEMEHLGKAYLRLADLADRNALTDIVLLPPANAGR